MKALKHFLILLVLFLSSRLLAAEQETISFWVSQSPPRYFKDDTGRWTGIDVELGRLLVETAGFKPIFMELPWKRAIKMMKSGELQFITNFSFKQERTEFAYYIGPERYTGRNLIVLQKHSKMVVNKLEDLIQICKTHKKGFGYQDSVSYSKAFYKLLETHEQFQDCFDSVPKPKYNLDKTVNGRILGFFGHPDSISYLMKTNPKYRNLYVHPFVLIREPAFFGVSKSGVNKNMLKRLYDAYEKLMQQGKIQNIRDQWLSTGSTE